MVRSWVAGIPSNNPGQQTRMIYAALAELNRTRLSHDHLRAALHELAPAIDQTLSHLRSHYAGLSAPFAGKRHSRAVLYLNILGEMCQAYNSLVWPNCDPSAGRLEPMDLANLVGWYSRLFQESYLLHYSVSRIAWRDFNRVIRKALAAKVVAPDDPLFTPFISIVLLSVMNPYALGRNDLDAVIQHLAGWSQYCRLSYPADLEASSGTIDPLTARPLAHGQDDKLGTHESQVRLLVAPLCKYLDEKIAETQNAPSSTLLASHDLLRRLRKALESGKLRARYRYRPSVKHDLIFGIEALMHVAKPSQQVQERERQRLMESQQLKASGKSVFEVKPVGPVEEDIHRLYEAQGNTGLKSSRREDRPDQRSWKAVSFAHGLTEHGLQVELDDLQAVALGDLVGIRSESLTSPWILGKINWMFARSDRSMHLGLEHICAELQPSRARFRLRGKERPTEHFTLLFRSHEDQVLGDYSLILPPGSYDAGLEMTVWNNQANLQLFVKDGVSSSENHVMVQVTPKTPGL